MQNPAPALRAPVLKTGALPAISTRPSSRFRIAGIARAELREKTEGDVVGIVELCHQATSLVRGVELKFPCVEFDVNLRRIVDPRQMSGTVLESHFGLGAANQMGVHIDPERGGHLKL